MTGLRLRRRLLKWGNAYGIRVTREEARRLRAREKDLLDVEVVNPDEPVDVARFPVFHLGRDARARHDEVSQEAADAGA